MNYLIFYDYNTLEMFKDINPKDFVSQFKLPIFCDTRLLNRVLKKYMEYYNSLKYKYNRFIFPYFELGGEFLKKNCQLFIEYFYDKEKPMDKIDPNFKYHLFDTLTDAYMFIKHQEIHDVLSLTRENMIRLKNTTELIRKSLANYYKNSGIKISCLDDAGKEISFKKALINQAKKDNFITDNFELINEFTEEVVGHPYESSFQKRELSEKYDIKSKNITCEIDNFMLRFMNMNLIHDDISDNYKFLAPEHDIYVTKADVNFLFEKNREPVIKFTSNDITDFGTRRYSFEIKELFWLCVNNYLKNNNISFKKDKDALSYLNTKGILSDTDIEQYNKFNSEVRNTFSHEGYKNNLTIEKINDMFNVCKIISNINKDPNINNSLYALKYKLNIQLKDLCIYNETFGIDAEKIHNLISINQK